MLPEHHTILPIDIHTHTVASGHGTTNTIADLAKAAAAKKMTALGISDHGPATPGSCKESYFRGLKNAPKIRAGIRIFYGAEVNILDENGTLDLPDEILAGLDYCIASIHPQSFHSSAYRKDPFQAGYRMIENMEIARKQNTNAYIKAMENPYVKIIGHPDDQHYPIDCGELVDAAVKNHVILEVNEVSLSPYGYRGDTADTAKTMKELLTLCRDCRHPILISSDSHGAKHVGEAPLAQKLIEEVNFPRDLIINYTSITHS